MKKVSKSIETNPFNLIQKEKQYLQHVTRLAQIAVDRKPNQDSQKALHQHNSRLQRSQDAMRRKKTQQLLEIQKDNDRILERLLKINAGTDRKQGVSGSQMRVAKTNVPELCKSPFENGKIKSLNRVSRKLDIIRIVNENVKLTEKIVFKQSVLSKAQMAKDYQNHQAISNRIRRVRLHEDRTLQIGHSVKLSQDCRIKSHANYLTAFPPINIPGIQHLNSSRASSVPKLEQKSQTLRSPIRTQYSQYQNSGQNSHRTYAVSNHLSRGSERAKSLTVLKPIPPQQFKNDNKFYITEIETNFYENELNIKETQNENETEIPEQEKESDNENFKELSQKASENEQKLEEEQEHKPEEEEQGISESQEKEESKREEESETQGTEKSRGGESNQEKEQPEREVSERAEKRSEKEISLEKEESNREEDNEVERIEKGSEKESHQEKEQSEEKEQQQQQEQEEENEIELEDERYEEESQVKDNIEVNLRNNLSKRMDFIKEESVALEESRKISAAESNEDNFEEEYAEEYEEL